MSPQNDWHKVGVMLVTFCSEAAFMRREPESSAQPMSVHDDPVAEGEAVEVRSVDVGAVEVGSVEVGSTVDVVRSPLEVVRKSLEVVGRPLEADTVGSLVAVGLVEEGTDVLDVDSVVVDVALGEAVPVLLLPPALHSTPPSVEL